MPSQPLTEVNPDLLDLAKEYANLERQVIIHCRFHPGLMPLPFIRIWPSTYLKPKGSEESAKLLQAFNISFYPEWQRIEFNRYHFFTLVFEGLPKDCTSFDLIEEIPEPGGFFFPNIKRNESDIYQVDLK
ncbi:MAG: hypothetical protein HWE07_14675 [Cytophagia bacterium]|nr:hypothetical protein [Cytophagia bacterium]